MPTQINNTASATYGFGRSSADSATSNVATTNLLSQYSLTATKVAQLSEFRPGDNVTYFVRVENNGTSPLQSVTISDDLGGVTNPLNYIENSAYLNYNGNITQIDPTSTTSPLVFTLPTALNPSENAVITYVARVDSGVTPAINTITNTATVTAQDGTGGTVNADQNPTATITLEEFASVQMVKSVSSDEIVAGQPFSYILILENSGNVEARDVVITDVLPQGFTVSSITSETNGVVTNYTTSDYNIDTSTNTLTLPSTGSSLTLSVPPFAGTGNGRTVVTITGSIN